MRLKKANQLLESVRSKLSEAPNYALTFRYMMDGEFRKIDSSLEKVMRGMHGVSAPGVEDAVSGMEQAILGLQKARERLDAALAHAKT